MQVVDAKFGRKKNDAEIETFKTHIVEEQTVEY